MRLPPRRQRHPFWLEDHGKRGWRLLSRETYREVGVSEDAANAYDRALDQGMAVILTPRREPVDAEDFAGGL